MDWKNCLQLIVCDVGKIPDNFARVCSPLAQVWQYLVIPFVSYGLVITLLHSCSHQLESGVVRQFYLAGGLAEAVNNFLPVVVGKTIQLFRVFVNDKDEADGRRLA